MSPHGRPCLHNHSNMMRRSAAYAASPDRASAWSASSSTLSSPRSLSRSGEGVHSSIRRSCPGCAEVRVGGFHSPNNCPSLWPHRRPHWVCAHPNFCLEDAVIFYCSRSVMLSPRLASALASKLNEPYSVPRLLAVEHSVLLVCLLQCFNKSSTCCLHVST